MRAFPADGFYPLMTFEESITCWKWPRRKYDEDSVIRGMREET